VKTRGRELLFSNEFPDFRDVIIILLTCQHNFIIFVLLMEFCHLRITEPKLIIHLNQAK